MNYNINDFYYGVSPFGSYDVKILVERANHYKIEIPDIIERTFDNWTKDQIFEEMSVGINFFFDSLLLIRIDQLTQYTRDALDSIEEDENEGITLQKRVQKLLKYLEECSCEKIHLNACCSCFDCDILDNKLYSVKSPSDIVKALEKMGDFEI